MPSLFEGDTVVTHNIPQVRQSRLVKLIPQIVDKFEGLLDPKTLPHHLRLETESVTYEGSTNPLNSSKYVQIALKYLLYVVEPKRNIMIYFCYWLDSLFTSILSRCCSSKVGLKPSVLLCNVGL